MEKSSGSTRGHPPYTEDEREQQRLLGRSAAVDSARRRAIAQQLRNLALLRPLIELDSNKTRHIGAGGELIFDSLDVLHLGLEALDCIAEHMALTEGATPAELSAHLVNACRRQIPTISTARAADVADRLIKGIANLDRAEGSERFSIPFFNPAVGTMDREEFRLLERTERLADGEMVFLLTAEGAACTLALLNQDLAALNAEELLIQLAVERERYADAQDLADQRRNNSRRLAGSLKKHIALVRRSVGRVNWVGEVLPQIRSARNHLEETTEKEGSLITVVRERIGEAAIGSEARLRLLELEEQLGDARDIHLELLSLAAGANEVYVEYQTDMFRARHAFDLVDPEKELFLPLASAPTEQASDLAAALTALLNRPRPVRLFDPALLIEHLEAEAESAPDEEEATPEDEYEAPPPVMTTFLEGDRERATALLNEVVEGGETITLDTLLAQARKRGFSHNQQLCLVYQALHAFNEADSDITRRYRAHIDGQLDDPLARGDNLAFKRSESDE